MKYRTLGHGLKVSAIGIGCMPMIRGGNIIYGAADDDVSTRTIHEAIDLGITFFDTAEMYGPFSNEELVGAAIKGKRDGLVIATKFAMRWEGNNPVAVDGSPENARRACEGSLKRLGIDTIDLFYQHRVDPDVPIEETVGAMAELVKQGKVKHLGLSEASAETLRKAHATHPIAAIQSEYSLWTRDVEENGVLETCRELGIGFVPFSPLGRGALTGALKSLDGLAADDFRRGLPRFQSENFDANLALIQLLEDMATEKGVTAGQLALAWVLAQGDFIVPIPGTTKIANLEKNVAAADVSLTAEEVASLGALLSPAKVAGERYPARMSQMANR